MVRLPIVPALLLTLAAPVQAHDFWIEPEAFHPTPGELVRVRLFVGHGDSADELPRDPEHLERFVLSSPAGETEVVGRPGARPAGIVRVPLEGVVVVGYESRGRSLRLDAARFESYLREEGLERVIDWRARLGESDRPGRETYFRCAKALLGRGSAESDGAHDRLLGLPLEIVAEADPYGVKAGGSLPVRVLYGGQPVEGVLVAAQRRGRQASSAERTDQEGRARLTLSARGLWIATAVHMTRAPAGEAVDWQSWWASLSFDNSVSFGPRP